MGRTSLTLPPGKKFKLREFDPGDSGDYRDKDEAREQLEKNLDRLRELQEVLYAENKRSLLIVVQAMDAGGKDGAIKHVMGAFNPQGVRVTPFKIPSEEELAHDFLWRIHKAAPQRGMIGIFNRSHYEEVLVVRVENIKPKKVWSKHYDHINEFERLLSDNGTRIVKFFLHISPDEQAERLRERQQRPDKQWKFNPGDLEDRARWGDFMQAYEDALTRCNTEWAPWYVIPSNRKWYRSLAISQILIETLEDMDLKYPAPVENVGSYEIPLVRGWD